MIKLRWLLICIGLYGQVMAGETITFEEILKKAITNSYELKISQIDIRLSKYAVKEVNALYFPTLNARFNTEYIKDSVSSVRGISGRGKSRLTDNSRSQDSWTVNFSYELSGMRRKKRLLAKKEVERQELIYQNNLKNLKLRILELYTQLILTYKELEAKKEILCLQKELFQLKERLFKAGTISKIDLADEAIRLAKVREEVERLKINLGLILEDISFYTGEDYDIGVGIADLDVGEELEADFINLIPQITDPEIQIYEKEIEKKKLELGILRREQRLQVRLYSNYTLDVLNRDESKGALGDLEKENWVVGIAIEMPLFQGVKTFTKQKMIKLEIEKMQLERDKKIAELKNLYAKESKSLQAYEQESETKKELLKDVQHKTDMIERLTSQQIRDKVVLLNQKIELISEQLEVEKTRVNKLASIKKLNIYTASQQLP